MLSFAGCSDAGRKQPMSMDEALASLEQARKDSPQPPPPPIEHPDESESEEMMSWKLIPWSMKMCQSPAFTVRR
jgi:hypothetical protein